MIVGYARVSTLEQDTALQVDALTRAGACRIVEEKRSGVLARPALDALLTALQPGDTVLVYKVDRFARSLADLLRVLDRISAAGAQFRSLTEPIDTTTPAGRMLTHLLGAFAEFERSMIRERCGAGIRAAQMRGVRFGRPSKLDFDQEEEARGLWREGWTQEAIAGRMGCSQPLISRVVRGVPGGRRVSACPSGRVPMP